MSNFNNVIGFNEAVYNESNKLISIYKHSNSDSGSSAIKDETIMLNNLTGTEIN